MTRDRAISIAIENSLLRQRGYGQYVVIGIFCRDRPSDSSRPSALGRVRDLDHAHAHARGVRTATRNAILSRVLPPTLVSPAAPLYHDMGDSIATKS